MTARRLPAHPARFAALLAATAAGALALAGCISVLPKEKPVQMYRFGVQAASVAAPGPGPAAAPKIGLVLARVEFPRASGGDRILAITGEQAAYVARARWVSPASVLFEDSVDRAFASSASVRLLGRGETGAAQGALRLDVSDFEARYASPGAAPVVRVTLQALLLRRNGSFVAEHAVSAEAPAAENGVRAIVAAYDRAVEQADGALVAWVDANAAQVLSADAALARPPGRVAIPISAAPTR